MTRIEELEQSAQSQASKIEQLEQKLSKLDNIDTAGGLQSYDGAQVSCNYWVRYVELTKLTMMQIVGTIWSIVCKSLCKWWENKSQQTENKSKMQQEEMW